MAKKSDLNVLDIPPECYKVKSWYSSRPSKELIKEIKTFVALTGRPHMFSGHTHTKPLPDDIPIYVDEFELPEAKRKRGYLAPCPCCSPRHAKYGRGIIAWFPEEGVIRLLGHDCFATLNKDAHDAALAEMRSRKQREADVAYLLKHHDRLLKAYQVIAEAAVVAEAIQTFSEELRYAVTERINIQLWERVRHGDLLVWETFRDKLSEGEIRDLERPRLYARLRGYQILNPDFKNYKLLVNQCIKGFQKVFESEDWDREINEMPDLDRHRLAKLINSSVKRARDLIAEMRELQTFVSPLNVATLRAWGARPDNMMPISFDREAQTIRIGKTEYARFPVVIPQHMEDELRDIDVPLISEMDADA